jgi:hypothetical protein
MTPFKGFDYRELFNKSDIKRAVAFLEFPFLLQYGQYVFLVHEFQVGLALKGLLYL